MYTAFIYRTGVQKGIRLSENAGELALEAAAQSYKNSLPNDTIKLIDYGTDRIQERTPKYILPENSRTEAASPYTGETKRISQTRKRTY